MAARTLLQRAHPCRARIVWQPAVSLIAHGVPEHATIPKQTAQQPVNTPIPMIARPMRSYGVEQSAVQPKTIVQQQNITALTSIGAHMR
jgi:hypothetical protein